MITKFQARNKPADGTGHVNQKGTAGQKAPLTGGQKGAPGAKSSTKPATKPSAQKGQVKVTPKAACVKTTAGKNKKKGQRQQYDLIVTINLSAVLAIYQAVPKSAISHKHPLAELEHTPRK
ncbi:hypothetical protein TKK_0014227 [Trichogramma kaykai]